MIPDVNFINHVLTCLFRVKVYPGCVFKGSRYERIPSSGRQSRHIRQKLSVLRTVTVLCFVALASTRTTVVINVMIVRCKVLL